MANPSYAVRASSFLHRSPKVRLLALLSVPMLWLVAAYLGSLGVMLAAAFWSTDSFTGALIHTFTWDNFRTLVQNSVYRTVALRTLGVAVAVTVIDAVIALPMAFYMAKVASPRWRKVLVA
ncbi:MAG: putative spermidine/putrescine transport system permease protein, partial [Frankiales bacterium]|nr:putative spermidine/putrescine transport system permease protein [Frankiales bacterium]